MIVEWQIYYTNTLPCEMGVVLLTKTSYCLQLFGMLHVQLFIPQRKKGLDSLVLRNYQWTSTSLLDQFGFLVICIWNCTNLQILFRSIKKGILSLQIRIRFVRQQAYDAQTLETNKQNKKGILTQIWFQPIVQHILCIFALIF